MAQPDWEVQDSGSRTRSEELPQRDAKDAEQGQKEIGDSRKRSSEFQIETLRQDWSWLRL